MAVSDWKFPGATNGSFYVGNVAWSNPGNIAADDGSFATVAGMSLTQTSYGLAAQDFDFSEIPVGASIDSIEIRVGDHRLTAGTLTFFALQLILPNSARGSENLNGLLTTPSGTATTDDLDRAGLIWDAAWGPFSQADVNNSNFGFFIRVSTSVEGSGLEVDYMQMRIHYHVGVPKQISVTSTVPGHSPPYKSSGGNFYVFTIYGGSYAGEFDDTTIRQFKATDPSGVWSGSDYGNEPDWVHALGDNTDVLCMSTFQDGDDIHIATMVNDDSDVVLEYHVFDTSTDTWGEVNTLVDTLDNDPTYPWCSIAVRSDGDVVVVYSGDTDQVMGGKKERVDVNIRTSGTWGGAVALDAADDIHYGNPVIVDDSAGTQHHIIWQQTTNTADPPSAWINIQGRTLDGSNNLSAVQTGTAGDSGGNLLGISNAVVTNDGSTDRAAVLSVYYVSGNSAKFGYFEEDGNNDIGSTPSEVFITDYPPLTVYSNGEVGVISGVVDGGTGDVWVVFSGGTTGMVGADQDIYYTSSDDGGDTWSARTEHLDGVTCNYISANVYVRGADTVLAYVYDDAGDTWYNEYVLVAGATGINPALLQLPTNIILRRIN